MLTLLSTLYQLLYICGLKSSLLAPTDVRKCEIRNHDVYKDYKEVIFLLDQLIFISRTKTMLLILSYLCCLCLWIN